MRTGEIQTGEMKGSQACTGHDSDRGPTATRPGTAGDDGDGTEDGGEGLIRGCGPTGRARPRKSQRPPRERREGPEAPRAGAGLLAAAHKSRISPTLRWRHSPEASSGSETGPIRVRTSLRTGWPIASHIRRTWRLRPSWMLTRAEPAPVRKPSPVPSSRRPGAPPGAAGRPRGTTGCRRPRPRTPLVPRSSGG